ncbi:hypothetical protein [Nocardia xishanensis]
MSEQASPSAWETDRFGGLALSLRGAVWRALEAAHKRALDGHNGFGLETNDAYGLMWLIQNQELAKAVEQIAPDARRIRPQRARYELTVVGDNNIILYPWRFSDDAYSPLDAAKMTLSKTREHLLSLTPDVSGQLSFEHAGLSEEELDAEFQDLETFLEDAAEAGRMVVIAYASNPHAGVIRVYWGDASQADDSGRLRWNHVEQIAPPSGTSGEDTGGVVVRPTGPRPDPNTETAARFDQHAPLSEFSLAPRTPLTAPDGGHPPTPHPETGNDA